MSSDTRTGILEYSNPLLPIARFGIDDLPSAGRPSQIEREEKTHHYNRLGSTETCNQLVVKARSLLWP